MKYHKHLFSRRPDAATATIEISGFYHEPRSVDRFRQLVEDGHQRVLQLSEIDIAEDIDTFEGLSASQFQEQLRALGEVEEILVNINSDGGDAFEGLAIFSMLERHPAKIITQTQGLAASVASVIAMAADPGCVRIHDTGFFMIHNPWAAWLDKVSGEAPEFRRAAEAIAKDLLQTAEVLEKVKPSILRAYRRHAKISEEEISAKMDETTWISASEAIEWGFAQEATGQKARIAARAAPCFLGDVPPSAQHLFGDEALPITAAGDSNAEPRDSAGELSKVALDQIRRQGAVNIKTGVLTPRSLV